MLPLTPPRFVTFAASLTLAALAGASLHFRLPMVGHYVAGHRIWFLIAAYVLLALGVVARGL